MRPLSRGQDLDLQVWPSYTDVLMNLTLVLLFYLFGQSVVSSQSSAALIEIRERQAELRHAVFQAVPASMRADVSVYEDGNLLKYTFAERVLFDSGDATLKESGEALLESLGRVFRAQSGSFTRIQIEGHTDDRVIRTARFPSNWELSSARATSVVRFFQDRCGIDPALLSATGYSEYHPVDPGDADGARSRNRRIEVVVVYSVRHQPGGPPRP